MKEIMENSSNQGQLLDTIMASQKQEELNDLNVINMINKALGGLKKKQRHVLKRRYGLVGTEPKTLQEIGDSYGVTRERIRQIEKAALRRLTKEVNYKYFLPVTTLITMELEKAGGVLAEDTLIRRILRNNIDELNANGLKLIFEVHPETELVKECDYKNTAWSLLDYNSDKSIEIIKDIVDYLEEKNEETLLEELHENLFDKHKIDPNHLESLLDLAKHVMQTPQGSYGLVTWPSINPKNIRDKIYFIFQKEKKPMHFIELTQRIASEDFLNKKRITHQAVHNELIADKRYVLIGKGIYALGEWGYQPGTVAEVIKSILEENNRPMSKEEIIKEVEKRRMVRPNTIIINLHNKNFFDRTKDNLFANKK